MIKKILVPVDGSDLSEGILSHVRRLLLRQDAQVLLLRVLSGESLPPREEEDGALHYLKELRGRLSESGISARHILLEGDPATEILTYADIADPSLIAMSTHGRGGLGRWARGSVAERVLRHPGHPLLMASPNGLDDDGRRLHAGFRRILVPLDGSEDPVEVIPLVREFASKFDSRVILLHAELPLPNVDQHLPSEPAPKLERYRDALRDADIPVRIRTAFGPAASAILDAVPDTRADLVAMTTHGRSGFSRLLLGSVAEEVLRHCSVPILALRRAGVSSAPSKWQRQGDRKRSGVA